MTSIYDPIDGHDTVVGESIVAYYDDVDGIDDFYSTEINSTAAISRRHGRDNGADSDDEMDVSVMKSMVEWDSGDEADNAGAADSDNDDDIAVGGGSKCEHLETVKESGTVVCCDCGLQLNDTLVDVEQRYYTPGDPTSINRHHIRRNDVRSLYVDLEKHGFPRPVMEMANTYYTQIIEGQIYRAKMRTAIVFACVFNAFKTLKEPRSPEEIAKIFGLDKKGISRGLKLFSSFFKGRVGNDHINALHLVPKLLANLNISNPLILEDLTKIYTFAEKNSQIYKSSTPQSVAAGIIWFYLKRAKIGVSKQQFSKVVGLTDITFTKLADETATCLGV